MTDRRESLVALGAGALGFALSPGAFGQPQGKVWRIGFLATRQEPASQAAFVRGMSDLGYVEGRNLLIESRASGGKPERLLKSAPAFEFDQRA